MLEPFVVLYAREHWRIIRADGCDRRPAFVIVDSAGTELRREADYDDAKAWIDLRVSDDHAHTRASLRVRGR